MKKRKTRKYSAEQEMQVLEEVSRSVGRGAFSGARAAAKVLGLPYGSVMSIIARNEATLHRLRECNRGQRLAELLVATDFRNPEEVKHLSRRLRGFGSTRD